MSLLGNNVFANPTTPIWGQGGGSNLPTDPTFNTVTFTPSGSPPYNSTSIGTFSTEGVMNSTLSILNGSNELGSLQGTAFYAGAEANYPRVIYQSDSIDYQAPDSTSYFLASVNSAQNGWELSNIKAINGVPYFNSPGTQFDYRSYPGGSPLVEAPDWGVLNSISFTAPVDGKVYVETLGTYIALETGAGVAMTFAVDGTNVAESPTIVNVYAGNTNFFGNSMLQFAVTANVTYDISSIAHCSAIPPVDPDVVVTSSRMFLMFSPN